MSQAAAVSPDPDPVQGSIHLRAWWVLGVIAGGVGMFFTSVQLLEKISKATDPDAVLVCDMNSVLSCSTVLDAWQSRVLGVPNSLVGLILFAILFTGALTALLGSRHAPLTLRVLWGLTVFFAFFASWFMIQTALVIGALCLWCTAITTAVLALVLVYTRTGVTGGAFGEGLFGRTMASAVRARQDLIVVGAWWLVIAIVLWAGLST
jgi:uncharacterized membrane protein